METEQEEHTCRAACSSAAARSWRGGAGRAAAPGCRCRPPRRLPRGEQQRVGRVRACATGTSCDHVQWGRQLGDAGVPQTLHQVGAEQAHLAAAAAAAHQGNPHQPSKAPHSTASTAKLHTARLHTARRFPHQSHLTSITAAASFLEVLLGRLKAALRLGIRIRIRIRPAARPILRIVARAASRIRPAAGAAPAAQALGGLGGTLIVTSQKRIKGGVPAGGEGMGGEQQSCWCVTTRERLRTDALTSRRRRRPPQPLPSQQQQSGPPCHPLTLSSCAPQAGRCCAGNA